MFKKTKFMVLQIALKGGREGAGGEIPPLHPTGRGTRNFAEGNFFLLGENCTRNTFNLSRLL